MERIRIVKGPNVGSDSFFVSVSKHQSCFDANTNQWQDCYIGYDFGNELGWGQEFRAHWRFDWCSKTNPGFEYGNWSSCFVNHWNVYVIPSQEAIPLVYTLKQGEYLVKFDLREDGTYLDKFRFVKWEPTLPTPTPLPTAPIRATQTQ
jgi:hypothetical protein